VETIEYRGYIIEIEADEYPMDPREWDNLGTMFCSHRRYQLGDENPKYDTDDYAGWDELEAAILADNPGGVILPLYLYDHSGITMRTYGFNDRWDSGQVGFIYAGVEAIRENYMVKRITKKTQERTKQQLKAEVDTYDKYLRGDVYSWSVSDPDGRTVESVSGYFEDNPLDDDSYMMQEARATVDSEIKDRRRLYQHCVKAWVKYKVPLEKRNYGQRP